MKVAVLWCQHSPMLGQWALSQTVCRPKRAGQLLEVVVVLADGSAGLEPLGLGRGGNACGRDLDEVHL